MERITRGFRLLGKSWDVLRADKELIGLAGASLVAMAAACGVMGGLYFGLVGGDLESTGAVEAVFGIVLTFVVTFIGVFTTAAIVAAATIRLDGGDPTVADGLRVAWSRVDRLITWTLLTVTVGLVLRAIRERAGALGSLIGVLAELAWDVITFLVVPVVLYEEEGAWGSVKRSAALFRARWGEQLVGNAALGLALIVAAIPVFLVLGAVATVSAPLAVVLGVLAVGALASVGSALSGVFRAALYQYAVRGEPVGPFTADDLGGAFTPRPRRRRAFGF